MIPYGLNPQQFQQAILKGLNQASDLCIKEFSALLETPFHQDIQIAEIEVFLGEEGMDLPTAWMYFRGRNNKVSSSDSSLFPGRSMEINLHLDANNFDFDERYYSREFYAQNIIGNSMKKWISECWWKAGGWLYKIPSTLAVHDGFGDGERVLLTRSRFQPT